MHRMVAYLMLVYFTYNLPLTEKKRKSEGPASRRRTHIIEICQQMSKGIGFNINHFLWTMLNRRVT